MIEALKSLYDRIAREPVPQRFRDLLKQMGSGK